MFLSGIVECRPALELKADRAANGLRNSHQLARRLFGFTSRFTPDGHEIGYFREAFIAHESRDQDIGFVQVHLLGAAFARGLQAEAAALLVIQ